MIRGVSSIVVAGPSAFAGTVILETLSQISEATDQSRGDPGSTAVRVGSNTESTTATQTRFAVSLDVARPHGAGARAGLVGLAREADG